MVMGWSQLQNYSCTLYGNDNTLVALLTLIIQYMQVIIYSHYIICCTPNLKTEYFCE